jgi:Ca-activated chloride channel family protein
MSDRGNMTKETNLYSRLNLPMDATPEEIRRAYREAARRLHPDTNEEVGQTELFLDVQQAYEVLSDPVRKIAYDGTIPAEAKKPPAVNLNTYYSRTTLPRIAEGQLVYTLLEMSVQSDVEPIQTSPLNICMVLDCSTSMQGTQMDTVKSTAIELIRQLRPVDTFGIVVFSDRAEVLVPTTSRLDRAQAETSVRMLQPHGGTEIFQGLELGLAEILRHRSRNHKNHMILITDGRTYGDEEQSLALAQRAAEVGITISGLGIGSKWNDAFLDNLASATGGNSMYVAKPKDIRKFLKEKFSGLSQSYAENVVFHFDSGENAQLRYAFRLQPETAPLDTQSPLHLGNLPRESSLSVLFEFEVTNIPASTSQVLMMEGRISFDIPSKITPTTAIRVKLSRAASNDVDNEAPPPAIVQAMSRLTLYRMQERARKDVGDGRIPEATRRLQNIATHLLAQGNRELARTVLAEANYLQQHQTFSEDGEKNLKYGTRNLLLPGNVEEKTL